MMKPTGIVRGMDDLGRISIPMSVRKLNGWEAGTRMEFYITDQGILLKPFGIQCVTCGSMNELIPVKNGHICKGCVGEAVQHG